MTIAHRLSAKNLSRRVLLLSGVDARPVCYTGRVRLLTATTNKGKLAELRRILSDYGLDVKGLDKLATTQEIETGATFIENALLKARHYHLMTGLPVIADDSGLEVYALAGAPGIHSARYAGAQATDSDRIARLLDELKFTPLDQRGARFVCAASIVWDGGERVFTGEVRGLIITEPRGQAGFGYDPVFYYSPLGKTFAEMTPEQKVEVSHRASAFHQLGQWLKQSGLLDTLDSRDKISNPTGDSSASSIRGDL